MTVVLEARDLAKSFVTRRTMLGRPSAHVSAVKGVSLQVAAGETLALVGESGAGKSTVGRLLTRLIEPDEGTVRLEGQDYLALVGRELRSSRARLRMVFQSPFSSLDPKMTVAASVAESLKHHTNLTSGQRQERVAELFLQVGLDGIHLDRYPYEFSGGQLQRVAIARAIATQPRVIICDEPVAALDMSIRAQVINLLADLQAELGLGYLFISHDLSLVRLIADRIAVMYRGLIVEEGPAEQIFRDPKHPYTRDLLAAVPVPDPSRGLVRSDDVQSPPNTVDEQHDLPGCDYADRCSMVMDRCHASPPSLYTVGDDWAAACYLHDPTRTEAASPPTGLGSAP